MHTPELPLRPIGPDEFTAAADLLAFVFASDFTSADHDAERSVFEYDRSLATFDGEQLVGSLSAYSFDMSVPGGSARVGGTTWVGVAPTHRRRGLLARAMTQHLRDVAERGEPLAALWASEASIYGRFGYGPAIEGQRVEVEVDGPVTWLDTAPPPPTSVSFVPLAEAAEVLDPIYTAARGRRAGLHARSQTWWHFQVLSTRKDAMGGLPRKYVAVAEVDGQPAAYAVYGLAEGPERTSGRPHAVLTLIEMAGVDAQAEASMWRYLLSHDLVQTVDARRRPVDDVLPLLLADSRRVVRRPGDALHVRVVDLPAALRARSYVDSAGVTIEVHDGLLEANDGTWRVEVAPEGVSVEPAEVSDADLRMDVKALGALYMGDVRLGRLAAAGMVDVLNPAVVPAVEAAFTAAEAGWAPEVW
ncbi:GNAT family N-acetyltransferase [Euzebya sp.]|uniref:GNAT family N-acetyltransferase n=1 Tax=Euzebya sp. TaxID=1971409 RepID=UPI003511A0FB